MLGYKEFLAEVMYLEIPRSTKWTNFNKINPKRDGYTHIGTLPSGHKVWHRSDAGIHTGGWHQFAVTGKTGKTNILLDTTNDSTKAHKIGTVEASRSSGGVHHLYHHLITKHGLMLSAHGQSDGGKKVWQKLQKMRGVHIHGFSNGKPHHVDLSDDTESHRSEHDLMNAADEIGKQKNKRNKAKADKEYHHEKDIFHMHLVAHKK